MSGINFSDLPVNLQKTLRPFMVGGRTVEGAIEEAKRQRVWTAENQLELNDFNGGQNWGKVMDEVAFSPAKAPEYKQEMAQASKKESASKDDDFFKFTDDKGNFSLANTAKTVGKTVLFGALSPLLLLYSCGEEDITEYNTTYNNHNEVEYTEIKDDSSLNAALAEIVKLLKEIKAAQEEGNQNSAQTNIKLDEVLSHLNAIITNQEKYAQTAEEFYFNVMAEIRKAGVTLEYTNELIKQTINKLTENNDILKSIETLMKKNNATDEEILKTITVVKYTLDNIEKLIEKLPDAIQDKFKAHLNAILAAIQANGAKIDDLTELLSVINENIVKGNEQQRIAADKILAALEALNFNLTSGVVAIIKAINSGNTALLAKMDKIIALMKQMDKNDEDRNNRILAAIASLDGRLLEGFEKLIKIGNKNNTLLEDSKKVQEEILLAIKNFKGCDIDIQTIIDHIDSQGSQTRAVLTKILEVLKTLNTNVVDGNNDNRKSFKLILDAINEKLGKGVDLTEVLNKLDKILEAIKDHKVLITFDDNGGHQCVDEGTREDLEWLLG